MSQLTDNLSAIASIKSDIRAAIESKGVSMSGVSFGSYAEKIGEIQTGGTFVTETLNVSNNGTYTPSQGVDGFSQVVVSVPQSVTGIDEKEYTEGILTISNVSNSASFVNYSVYAKRSEIQTVNLPNCTQVYADGFGSCSYLYSVVLSSCVSIGNAAFSGCSRLSYVSLPVCEYLGYYAFGACTSLTKIDLPNCISMSGSPFNGCYRLSEISIPECIYISNYAFQNCSSLTKIVLPKCSHLGNNVFHGCINLSQVVIEYDSVCEIGSFPTYGFTGDFYVPSSLVEAYKSASNWSDYSNRIFPIPE